MDVDVPLDSILLSTALPVGHFLFRRGARTAINSGPPQCCESRGKIEIKIGKG